jgi:hypothetical protein
MVISDRRWRSSCGTRALLAVIWGLGRRAGGVAMRTGRASGTRLAGRLGVANRLGTALRFLLLSRDVGGGRAGGRDVGGGRAGGRDEASGTRRAGRGGRDEASGTRRAGRGERGGAGRHEAARGGTRRHEAARDGAGRHEASGAARGGAGRHEASGAARGGAGRRTGLVAALRFLLLSGDKVAVAGADLLVAVTRSTPPFPIGIFRF